MRQIDMLAQERFSISSLILMENAGICVRDEILRYSEFQKNELRKIAIFCGKGNNGGDGFVVARHLRCEGIAVTVYLLGKSDDIRKNDAYKNFRPLRKMGVKVVELTDMKGVRKMKRSFSCDAICDAIFGTGFSGRPPEHIENLIRFINNYNCPRISVDVPSGLDAATGIVKGACVKADITVTFGLPKIGFVRKDGPTFAGEVITRNISFPREILK